MSQTRLQADESKNRIIAMISSVLLHVVILLILIFTNIISLTAIPEAPIYGLGMEGDFDGNAEEDGGGQQNIPIEEVIETTEETEGEENNSEEGEDVVTAENSETEINKKEETEEKKQENTNNNNSSNNNGENEEPGKKKGNGGVGNDLKLAGYDWDSQPNWNEVDNEDEEGEIIFEVVVDEEGGILTVKILSSTVSRKVANRYRDAIYDEAAFQPTSGVTIQSTGKLKVEIKSR